MKRETKKRTYGRASEDMDMVKVSEDLDDELGGKVLDGGVHGCVVGSGDLG